MLALKSKGLDNAGAVLGGYDALVKAGFPIEKGKPTATPEPAAVEKKVESAPAAVAQTDVITPTTAKVTPVPSSTPAKHSRRRPRRRRHRGH